LAIHALHCPLVEKLTKNLHDTLRDRIATFLRRILPDNARVEVERDIGAGGQRKHVDIRVTATFEQGPGNMVQRTWNLDVTVVNPCCYVDPSDPRQSAEDPTDRLALREAERRKHSAYQGKVSPDDLLCFVPLAAEVTGRLGPAFEAFIKEIGERCGIKERWPEDTPAVVRLLHKNHAAVEIGSLRYDMSSIIARFNGFKILALRDRQRSLEAAPPRQLTE
jgi:hypothetical protein